MLETVQDRAIVPSEPWWDSYMFCIKSRISNDLEWYLSYCNAYLSMVAIPSLCVVRYRRWTALLSNFANNSIELYYRQVLTYNTQGNWSIAVSLGCRVCCHVIVYEAVKTFAKWRYLMTMRSLRRYSKASLNVRPSIRKSFSDFNEIWYVDRGRWVIHDSVIPHDTIQGQGQGHGGPKVVVCALVIIAKRYVL